MLSRTRSFAMTVSAALLFAFVPTIAQAQRPVITRNADEPGRVPYNSSFPLQSCSNGGCAVYFAPVPAGYRLVITYMSVLFSSATPTPSYISLTTTAAGTTDTPEEMYLPLPVSAGPNSGVYVVSAPIHFYAEPGSTPFMFLAAELSQGQVTGSLTGYLVALN